MTHIILGLCGKKRSGKSTLANHLVQNHGFVSITIAEPLKETIGRRLFYLTEEQLYGAEKDIVDPRWDCTPRSIWQSVGRYLRDQFGEDFLGKRALYRVGELLVIYPKGVRAVISDIRLPRELEMIDLVGGLTCRVIKEGQESEDQDETETSLDNYETNFTITAPPGDLEEIYKQADKLMEGLEKHVVYTSE